VRIAPNERVKLTVRRFSRRCSFSGARRMTKLKAHRGDLMVLMGILSVIVGPPLVSVATWLVAQKDLREMDAGQMDPAGRSKTQMGHRLAIISTIGWPVLWSCCCMGLVAYQLMPGGRFVPAIDSRRITVQEHDRIKFRMTKQQVSDLLGPPAKIGRHRTDSSRTNWYWYEKNGRATFQVTFDTKDRVEGTGAETPD
jgi:hypothetical protein